MKIGALYPSPEGKGFTANRDKTVRWSLYVPKTLKLEVEKWLEIHIKNSNEKNEMPEYKSSSGIASELFRQFLINKTPK